MANRSKAKGTRAETRLCKYLADHGIQATRQPLSGSLDRGDVKVMTTHGPVVVEVKAGAQTTNPSRAQLTEWLRQTEAEGHNTGLDAYLCVMRYNRRIQDAEIYLVTSAGRCVQYLDEWVESLGGEKHGTGTEAHIDTQPDPG